MVGGVAETRQAVGLAVRKVAVDHIVVPMVAQVALFVLADKAGMADRADRAVVPADLAADKAGSAAPLRREAAMAIVEA